MQLCKTLYKVLPALLETPHGLVVYLRALGLLVFIVILQLTPLLGLRRPSLRPQLLHGQEVLDVVAEELGEELLRVVVTFLGPLTGGHAAHGRCGRLGLLAVAASILSTSVLLGSRAQFRVLGVWRDVLVGILLAKQLVEEVLGPDDAVYGLRGGVPDGAAGEGLLVRLGLALVALGGAALDDRDLAQVSRAAALHQGDVGRQAHPVDVATGLTVVQGVQHDLELLEPRHVVLGSNKLNDHNCGSSISMVSSMKVLQ